LSEASSTESVNRKVLGQLQPEQVSRNLLVQEAEDCIVEKSELVEMWIRQKQATSPDGYGMRPQHRQVLIYVLGREKTKYSSS